MTFRLLIDECLSPDLVQLAIAAGHVESTCVRNRGWAGTKDWQLIEHIVANDYTLVTHNSVDFRGHGPGSLGGEHANQTNPSTRGSSALTPPRLWTWNGSLNCSNWSCENWRA